VPVHSAAVPVQSAQRVGEQEYDEPHEAQLVVEPVQPLADHEHPLSDPQSVCVVLSAHWVIAPAHVELQVQPYSAPQAVEVAFALQGVTVPLHVPAFQLQPYWYVQADDVASDAHGVRVPVQAVLDVQPALLHKLVEVYVSHVDGVPLHV
jgi:hypothetical protein